MTPKKKLFKKRTRAGGSASARNEFQRVKFEIENRKNGLISERRKALKCKELRKSQKGERGRSAFVRPFVSWSIQSYLSSLTSRRRRRIPPYFTNFVLFNGGEGEENTDDVRASGGQGEGGDMCGLFIQHSTEQEEPSFFLPSFLPSSPPFRPRSSCAA